MKGRAIHYDPEELAWIERNKDLARDQMHKRFCFLFQRQDVTEENLKRLCGRRGWSNGQTGRFVKGQTPPNKGKKMAYHPNSAATRFKKGQRPVNKLDVGEESIDRDGYVKICVAEPNPWTGAPTHMAFKHRWLWEQANGPVPAGHVLKCLSADKTNTDPSNWEPISQVMLPRLNGRFGRDYDAALPELKPTIMAIAKLEHRARAAKKGTA